MVGLNPYRRQYLAYRTCFSFQKWFWSWEWGERVYEKMILLQQQYLETKFSYFNICFTFCRKKLKGKKNLRNQTFCLWHLNGLSLQKNNFGVPFLTNNFESVTKLSPPRFFSVFVYDQRLQKKYFHEESKLLHAGSADDSIRNWKLNFFFAPLDGGLLDIRTGDVHGSSSRTGASAASSRFVRAAVCRVQVTSVPAYVRYHEST